MKRIHIVVHHLHPYVLLLHPLNDRVKQPSQPYQLIKELAPGRFFEEGLVQQIPQTFSYPIFNFFARERRPLLPLREKVVRIFAVPQQLTIL